MVLERKQKFGSILDLPFGVPTSNNMATIDTATPNPVKTRGLRGGLVLLRVSFFLALQVTAFQAAGFLLASLFDSLPILQMQTLPSNSSRPGLNPILGSASAEPLRFDIKNKRDLNKRGFQDLDKFTEKMGAAFRRDASLAAAAFRKSETGRNLIDAVAVGWEKVQESEHTEALWESSRILYYQAFENVSIWDSFASDRKPRYGARDESFLLSRLSYSDLRDYEDQFRDALLDVVRRGRRLRDLHLESD